LGQIHARIERNPAFKGTGASGRRATFLLTCPLGSGTGSFSFP
jgi:hypothetical protein